MVVFCAGIPIKSNKVSKIELIAKEKTEGVYAYRLMSVRFGK